MNVASLELCKELYELSEWDEQFPVLLHYLDNEVWHKKLYQSDARDELTYCPAYTLGYLLRKLPADNETMVGYWKGGWKAVYVAPNGTEWRATTRSYLGAGDTPEDAVTKLTIELFKQNILTKET